MQAYLNLLQDVLDNGKEREDRTKTGTISVFGRIVRFDLRDTLRVINPRQRLEDYSCTDYVLENYHPQPAIKAPVSV